MPCLALRLGKTMFAEESNGIIEFEGPTPGPRIIVMGGVHGNEGTGIECLKWLNIYLRNNPIKSGTVVLCHGNPEATRQNKRFIDEDLNRLMREDILDKIRRMPPIERNTEQNRALLLANILQAAHVIDLHNTESPTERTFCITSQTTGNQKVAAFFQLDTTLYVAEDAEIPSLCTGMDDYANANGMVGVCVEAGYTYDPQGFKSIQAGIIRTLQHFGVIPTSHIFDHSEAIVETQEIYQQVMVKDPATFKFAQNWTGFTKVQAGQVLAYQGETPIQAEEGSFIIFPKNRERWAAGKPSLYLARAVSSTSKQQNKRKDVACTTTINSQRQLTH